MVATHSRQLNRSRKVTLWVAAAILALVLFAVGWILVRALMARDELIAAVPTARSIATGALNGETADLSADMDELSSHAAKAASLTSDPIWRAGELVPVIGSNLTTFRQAAAMIDQLAEDVLPPLADLATTFTVDSLSPVNGTFDLQTFADAAPLLNKASAALDAADALAVDIDTESTIPQIGSAIDQVVDLVSQAKDVVGGIDTAASLIPSMMGADGARTYLLLSLNNSELRATGGLPGAIAVVTADEGTLSLGTLSTATALGEFDSPVLPLTDAESTLYGDVLATYMHDVNYTPDFARSGELAQAMWLERTGQTVDGVLTLDPIALSYILEATGPIDAGSGVTLSSDNAASVLLSDVYSMFAKPADQDAFFAGVTGKIFSAVTAGVSDSSKLITALTSAADENRIHLWSAHSDEEAKLEGTPIVGAVPVSTDETTAFGVYFNDATGAKMDYYLSSAIAIASGVCRNDQRPNFEVKIQLTSTAPADAATSLSSYVTGGGTYGVTPGNIATNVFVYAPAGSVPYSVTIDGQEFSFVSTESGDHSVAGVNVELAPGQQSVVTMKFVGLAGAADAVSLQHTPMVSAVETSLDNYLDCSEVAPAPTEEDGEQTGALSALGLEAALRKNEASQIG